MDDDDPYAESYADMIASIQEDNYQQELTGESQ